MNTINYSLKKLKGAEVFNMIITAFVSCAVTVYLTTYEQNFYSITYISIMMYIIFFITWFTRCKRKLNFYTIFLVFTYVFYFGQFFLFLIGIPFQTNRTIIGGLLPYESIIKTGILILIFMMVLHLGLLLSTFNINIYCNNKESDSKQSDFNYKNIDRGFEKIALILFIISIIPSFIVLTNNIKITFTYGYGAIFQSQGYTSGGFNNILRFISRFTIPSFLMLFILYKNDKKLKIINIIFTVYIGMYFLSGSRLDGVLLLVVILLIKHNWYKPFNKRVSIKMCIYIVIGLVILSLISAVRNSIYVSSDFSYLITTTVKNIITNNPLFVALEEAGYTFLAIATVVSYCPVYVPYNMGLSYFNSIFMLMPNLFWDVHPAAKSNTDIVFKGFLTQYGGIGSSFIAESYYNFGFLCIVLALIFGVLIGILTKNIMKYSKEWNVRKFYLYIYIAQFSLFYVRSDTVGFWRNFVYYGLLPIMIASLLSKKNNVRK